MAMLRAYLFDATYEWMTDHSLTPHILVDSEYEDVAVPTQYIEGDGKILLNISQDATENLKIDDTTIQFEASFDGQPMTVSIPVEAVLEFFSPETEQGLYGREFGYGINVHEGNDENDVDPSPKPKKPTGLHLV